MNRLARFLRRKLLEYGLFPNTVVGQITLYLFSSPFMVASGAVLISMAVIGVHSLMSGTADSLPRCGFRSYKRDYCSIRRQSAIVAARSARC